MKIHTRFKASLKSFPGYVQIIYKLSYIFGLFFNAILKIAICSAWFDLIEIFQGFDEK